MLENLAYVIGLSAKELRALLEVRDELIADEPYFDMRDGCYCIAGYMGRRLGIPLNQYTTQIGNLPMDNPMRALCYPRPNTASAPWQNPGYVASPVQAAHAIDRMLAGMEPWPWI